MSRRRSDGSRPESNRSRPKRTRHDVKEQPEENQQAGKHRSTIRRLLLGGAAVGGLALASTYSQKPAVETESKVTQTNKPGTRTIQITEFDGKPIVVPKAEVAPATQEEIETHKRIEAVEAGLIAFIAKLDSKLPDGPEGERLRNIFSIPRAFVKFNMRENEQRSAMTYEREHGFKRGSYKIDGRMATFYYAFEGKDYSKSAASFATSPRTMLLSDLYDPTNDADNLVLMHELMHVHYDTLTRSSVTVPEAWEVYHSIHQYKRGSKPPYNVIDEARGYSIELDALNVLLDGELKRAVETGEGMSLSEIHRAIGATRPNQLGPIDFAVSTLGHAYFGPGEKDVGGFSRLFLDRLASAAQARGYDTVIPHEDGSGLRPYQQHM